MKKYEKIAKEIEDQSFFNNINKESNKIIEFHQMIPKISTNLFVNTKIKKY